MKKSEYSASDLQAMLNTDKMIIDLNVKIDTLIELLIAKKVATREEIDTGFKVVAKSEDYKDLYKEHNRLVTLVDTLFEIEE